MRWQVSKAVSNLLFYVTFSANFFLYCISGDRFRSTLRRVLRRCLCCCVGDQDRSSMLATLRKSWTETHQHHVTSQRSTLASSLACATVTAVPNPVTVPRQARPSETDLSSVDDQRFTTANDVCETRPNDARSSSNEQHTRL